MLGNEQKIRLLPGDKVQKGKKMKLYIIRHGETSWNKQKKLQGQRDIMLNDAGIRLAELTGEGMKDIDFDLVISSPLIRAKQTAELVMAGRHLPMITDRRIIELSFGDWEGECVRDSKVLPPDFIDKFYNDPYHCMRAPGGESFQDVLNGPKIFISRWYRTRHMKMLRSSYRHTGQPDAVFWQIFMMIKKISGAGESRKTVLSHC